VQDLYTFCAHFTLHVSVNSLHPAQWLLTEHMISLANTLEANEYEDAENPNTDDCKVLPMLLAELQSLSTKHLRCTRVYC
jgi:hypothetical protein